MTNDWIWSWFETAGFHLFAVTLDVLTFFQCYNDAKAKKLQYFGSIKLKHGVSLESTTHKSELQTDKTVPTRAFSSKT